MFNRSYRSRLLRLLQTERASEKVIASKGRCFLLDRQTRTHRDCRPARLAAASKDHNSGNQDKRGENGREYPKAPKLLIGGHFL